MRTIVFIKRVNEYKEGDIATVENNRAHYFIDNGFARLRDTDTTDYDNRMMSDKSKNYKVKNAASKLRNLQSE